MKNSITFIFAFVLTLLIHLLIFFKIDIPKPTTSVTPQKKHSLVINLKKIVIKEVTPLPIEKKITPPIVEEVKKVVIPPKKIKKRALKKVVKKPKKRKKVKKKKKRKKVVKRRKKTIKKVQNRLQKSSPRLKALEKSYLMRVRKIIEKNKKYPRIARRMRQEGIVKVQFRIEKNGKITHIVLVGRSAYSRLNQAGVKILKAIKKFASIPKALNKSYLTVTIPIKYKI